MGVDGTIAAAEAAAEAVQQGQQQDAAELRTALSLAPPEANAEEGEFDSVDVAAGPATAIVIDADGGGGGHRHHHHHRHKKKRQHHYRSQRRSHAGGGGGKRGKKKRGSRASSREGRIERHRRRQSEMREHGLAAVAEVPGDGDLDSEDSWSDDGHVHHGGRHHHRVPGAASALRRPHGGAHHPGLDGLLTAVRVAHLGHAWADRARAQMRMQQMQQIPLSRNATTPSHSARWLAAMDERSAAGGGSVRKSGTGRPIRRNSTPLSHSARWLATMDARSAGGGSVRKSGLGRPSRRRDTFRGSETDRAMPGGSSRLSGGRSSVGASDIY